MSADSFSWTKGLERHRAAYSSSSNPQKSAEKLSRFLDKLETKLKTEPRRATKKLAEMLALSIVNLDDWAFSERMGHILCGIIRKNESLAEPALSVAKDVISEKQMLLDLQSSDRREARCHAFMLIAKIALHAPQRGNTDTAAFIAQETLGFFLRHPETADAYSDRVHLLDNDLAAQTECERETLGVLLALNPASEKAVLAVVEKAEREAVAQGNFAVYMLAGQIRNTVSDAVSYAKLLSSRTNVKYPDGGAPKCAPAG